MNTIGIRREDKNDFERRVPLVPSHVTTLHQQGKIQIALQTSPRRIYLDEEYRQAGAIVREDLEDCPIIMGVKQIPIEKLTQGKVYIFFSHTIKGQSCNMPMLRRILELGCTLIDYERIVDEQGRRLVFFGKHAGLAGMVDTLWCLGQRLLCQGMETPLASLRPAHTYSGLEEIKTQVTAIGRALKNHALPRNLWPLTFGVTGYGNVSRGAQEILDLLQPITIQSEDLSRIKSTDQQVFKVVFHEEHLVKRISGCSATFDLQEYYQHPENYQSIFSQYLPHLTVLVNSIYWEPRYPRLVTLDDLRQLYSGLTPPRLQIIGDISCDIEGSIEATVRATVSENPVYVYDLVRGETRDGFKGQGPVIMAVDNLPAELPKEASDSFSSALLPFIPALSTANYQAPLDQCGLPDAICRAVIVHRGVLTDSYRHLEKFI